MLRLAAVLLTALLVSGLVVSETRAQERPLAESLTGPAKAAYDSGAILYRDGDFPGSCLKFRRAYELSQDYRLLWNQAACEKNQRHYAEALALLRSYLAKGGAKVSTADRNQAQMLIRTISEFVASVELSVQPAGARVTIDGVEVGKAPFDQSVPADQGPREIKIELEGYKTYTETHNLPGGTSYPLKVTLEQDIQAGLLRVSAGAQDKISVDGKQMGTGRWEGPLPPGLHMLQVTGTGKVPYETKVEVKRDQINSTHVALRPELDRSGPGGIPQWVFALGGIGLVAAVGITSYYATRSDPHEAPVTQGTMSPGRVDF